GQGTFTACPLSLEVGTPARLPGAAVQVVTRPGPAAVRCLAVDCLAPPAAHGYRQAGVTSVEFGQRSYLSYLSHPTFQVGERQFVPVARRTCRTRCTRALVHRRLEQPLGQHPREGGQHDDRRDDDDGRLERRPTPVSLAVLIPLIVSGAGAACHAARLLRPARSGARARFRSLAALQSCSLAAS